MQRSTARAGFTLLEMGIVLAIIGLLVGGILGIRTYVKSAELTTLMNQSKYYINAFNQFQDRYQYPPGDLATASNIWSGVGNGDGNGLIRTNSTCKVTPTTCNNAELFQAFQHLQKAGYIDGNYTGTTNGGIAIGATNINLPLSAVNNVTFLLDHTSVLDGNALGNGIYFDGLYSHVLRVAKLPTSASASYPLASLFISDAFAAPTPNYQLPSLGFMSPQTALKLDSKFDDGVPSRGWVMTGNATVLPNCTPAANNMIYSTTYTADDACYFIMRIQ